MNLWKRKSFGTHRSIIRNRIVASALVAALGIGCIPTVYASAISDAQNKKNQAQSNLENQNEKIDELQSQRESLQSEINKLDADLVNVLTSMSILDDELADKETQLEEVNRQLSEAKEEEKAQYSNMKKRIRYMYENGNTSFLEIVLGATDFADFLNRVEYAGQVYEHDRELLTSYQETVQQVADLKLQVESEKSELEEMRVAYEEQEQEYQRLIKDKKKNMAGFDVQLASAKELAEEYKQVISKQNQVIQEEEQRQKEAEEQRQREEEQKKKQEDENKGSSNGGNTDDGKSNGGGSDTNSGGGGNKNPAHATNVSGTDVVNYACQFIGCPYVMGGTSLTNGSDCSGFVMSVFANFGISLPHSSYALQSCGKEVSYSNAQPGDLICYAGHVAIYMGGGQIVHASNSAPYPAGGIKTNGAAYRQILTVRRVL